MNTQPKRVRELIARIVLAVAELPDRDSPEDQPELMLVSGDELTNIIANALDSCEIDDGFALMPTVADRRMIDAAMAVDVEGEDDTIAAYGQLYQAFREGSFDIDGNDDAED